MHPLPQSLLPGFHTDTRNKSIMEFPGIVIALAFEADACTLATVELWTASQSPSDGGSGASRALGRPDSSEPFGDYTGMEGGRNERIDGDDRVTVNINSQMHSIGVKWIFYVPATPPEVQEYDTEDLMNA